MTASDWLPINTIRTLVIDAVQAAQSGHRRTLTKSSRAWRRLLALEGRPVAVMLSKQGLKVFNQAVAAAVRVLVRESARRHDLV